MMPVNICLPNEDEKEGVILSGIAKSRLCAPYISGCWQVLCRRTARKQGAPTAFCRTLFSFYSGSPLYHWLHCCLIQTCIFLKHPFYQSTLPCTNTFLTLRCVLLYA